MGVVISLVPNQSRQLRSRWMVCKTILGTTRAKRVIDVLLRICLVYRVYYSEAHKGSCYHKIKINAFNLNKRF